MSLVMTFESSIIKTLAPVPDPKLVSLKFSACTVPTISASKEGEEVPTPSLASKIFTLSITSLKN